MSIKYQEMKSPIGRLVVAGTETHLAVVVFRKLWPSVRKRFDHVDHADTPVLKAARQQLREYFDGKRTSFDLPLHVSGTAFQTSVWRALASIPFGQTRTYKQQALAINHPKAIRAVGRTNGLNPLCIVIPCHRVIGSDGALTGYAGGLDAKKFLLMLEGIK